MGLLCEGYTWRDHIVNSLVLLIVLTLTVFAFIFDIYSSDFEKVIFVVACFLSCLTAMYSFFIPTPEEYQGGVFDVLRYKNVVCLGAVPNLYNIYLDIAVCFELHEKGQTELLYFSITSLTICRLLTTYWVWQHFHDLKKCALQLFELFQFHEMLRIRKARTILLSLYKLREIAIVCEDLPQFLVKVAYIAQANSKGDSVSPVIYSSIFFTVYSVCMGTKDLDNFMWERYADKDKSTKNAEKKIFIFRVFESLSSMLTIGIIHYYYQWEVSMCLVGSVFGFVWIFVQMRDPFERFVHSIIWLVRAPTFTYESFEQKWLESKRRGKIDEHIVELTSKFYDQCNEALSGHWFGKDYEIKMEKLYDDYEFDNPGFDLKASVCGLCEGASFWKVPFYKIHVGVRVFVNFAWIIVMWTHARELNKIVQWTYFGLAVITNGGMVFLAYYWLTIAPITDYYSALPLHTHMENPKNPMAQSTPLQITTTHSLTHSPILDPSPSVTSSSIALLHASREIIMENLVYLGYELKSVNEKGETLLSLAARLNDGVMIEYLLSAGFDANQVDGLGQTPLCVSILFQKHKAINAFLPVSGHHHQCDFILPVVNINLPCTGGYRLSPLLCCGARCDIETAGALRSRYADVNYSGVGGNLYHIIFDSHESYKSKFEFVVEIGDWGIDVNDSVDLQEIAKLQKTPSVDQEHEDVDLVEYKWVTVLWRYIQKSAQIEKDTEEMEYLEKVIRSLLEHGADANHSCLPLHCAFDYANKWMIQTLLDNNADPNQKNENEQTLLVRCVFYDPEFSECSESLDIVECAKSLLTHKDIDIEADYEEEKLCNFVCNDEFEDMFYAPVRDLIRAKMRELGIKVPTPDSSFDETTTFGVDKPETKPPDDVPASDSPNKRAPESPDQTEEAHQDAVPSAQAFHKRSPETSPQQAEVDPPDSNVKRLPDNGDEVQLNELGMETAEEASTLAEDPVSRLTPSTGMQSPTHI